MTALTVSVIVCAYTEERWDLLVRAVESASAQLDRGEVILVIDNNPALLARSVAQWPAIAVIPNEGPRGLSRARNTGIAFASGDVLVFLDDDASGQEGWLAALVAPFVEPDVIATGGVAEPLWPQRRPQAIPAELDWVVGCSFTGQPRDASVRNVMGCNMAFRAAELRAIGGFETALGRVGALPLGAEETDACIRLRRRHPDMRIAFAERAVVSHAVTPARARLRYVVSRSYAEGISKAAMAARLGGESLSTESSYLRRTLPRAVVREVAHVRPLGAFAICASVAAAGAGFIRGSLRMRGTAPVDVESVVIA